MNENYYDNSFNLLDKQTWEIYRLDQLVSESKKRNIERFSSGNYDWEPWQTPYLLNSSRRWSRHQDKKIVIGRGGSVSFDFDDLLSKQVRVERNYRGTFRYEDEKKVITVRDFPYAGGCEYWKDGRCEKWLPLPLKSDPNDRILKKFIQKSEYKIILKETERSRDWGRWNENNNSYEQFHCEPIPFSSLNSKTILECY